MSQTKPKIQNAIRLTKFFVNSLEFHTKKMNTEEDVELHIDLKVSTGFIKNEDRKYIINFDLNIISQDENLQMKVRAGGIFEAKDIMTEVFKKSDFVRVNSPAIAFPFLRSYINTITTNSGISPIILPSFNFAKKDPKTNKSTD